MGIVARGLRRGKALRASSMRSAKQECRRKHDENSLYLFCQPIMKPEQPVDLRSARLWAGTHCRPVTGRRWLGRPSDPRPGNGAARCPRRYGQHCGCRRDGVPARLVLLPRQRRLERSRHLLDPVGLVLDVRSVEGAGGFVAAEYGFGKLSRYQAIADRSD